MISFLDMQLFNFHKTLEPNRQDMALSTHENFKNTGSKPVRDRFHGCGILASNRL